MNNKLATVIAIAAIALVGCDEDAMHEAFNLQHDLLITDFAEGDGSFVTSDEAHASVETYDGTYRMTAKQPLDMPISSFGWFSRTAYNVHNDVTVVRVNSDDAIVGTMCLDGNACASEADGDGLFVNPELVGNVRQSGRVEIGRSFEVLVVPCPLFAVARDTSTIEVAGDGGSVNAEIDGELVMVAPAR